MIDYWFPRLFLSALFLISLFLSHSLNYTILSEELKNSSSQLIIRSSTLIIGTSALVMKSFTSKKGKKKVEESVKNTQVCLVIQ